MMALNEFTVTILFNENSSAMRGKIFIPKPTDTAGFMSRALLSETWQRLGGATSSSLGQVQGAVQRPFMHPPRSFDDCRRSRSRSRHTCSLRGMLVRPCCPKFGFDNPRPCQGIGCKRHPCHFPRRREQASSTEPGYVLEKHLFEQWSWMRLQRLGRNCS